MKLKDARINANYTQDDAGKDVGITGAHYRNIENGKAIPSVIIAKRICALFEVSIDSIDEWDEDKVEMKSKKRGPKK